MYLSIATTHAPATDLGYLLMKHPDRLHETELAFGKAHVFFPEASERRCEAVLSIDIDPVGLVRGRGRADGLLDQYVNDRPYAASSFLSVALNRVFRTAMTGACRERPELAATEIPLELAVTPLPARGGDDLVESLFAPLGWRLAVERIEGLNGQSRYVKLGLTGVRRLSEALSHLYVLIPVLDEDKHYWVGEEEVEKLLAKGGAWLAAHPQKELIARRYLKNRRGLARAALARLAPEESDEETTDPSVREAREEALEEPLRLNEMRLQAVMDALAKAGAKTVVDLGCGEGKLLARLASDRRFEELIGLDASVRSLERASERLKLNRAGGLSLERVKLLHGSLTYRDARWSKADAAVLVEVIEHVEPDRLPALAQVVFGAARPKFVIVTTPNAEHNVLFPDLAAGAFRHPDHRFEWTRAQFNDWASGIAARYGYAAEFSEIGAAHETHGAPTQMAFFQLRQA
jgi:3' terminal RNA ribose 2'-O-methyltransferase Hen1